MSNLKPELAAILKKYNVQTFEFVQTGEWECTLRTDEPATQRMQHELQTAIGGWFKIHFEALPKQPLLPGITGALSNANASNVNHPAHYNSGKIEVIEAIEDWKLNYHRGSVVKYTARAGKKDPTKEIEDLEKAAWYIKREIERLTAARDKREVTRPNDMNLRGGSITALDIQALKAEATWAIVGDWLTVETENGDKQGFIPRDPMPENEPLPSILKYERKMK